ncbi:hypothetical protein D1007_49229 [Hordeum vulgare]|nr:hypothetical protein D1007_49229 [Hordeum vulgare]
MVKQEEEEDEAAYLAALVEAFINSIEEERRKAEAAALEEATYEAEMVEDMALSAIGDCVVLPWPPTRKREWEEEEERACVPALPPPQHKPKEEALAVYKATFGCARLPPVFINLTADNDDNKGTVKAGV